MCNNEVCNNLHVHERMPMGVCMCTLTHTSSYCNDLRVHESMPMGVCVCTLTHTSSYFRVLFNRTALGINEQQNYIGARNGLNGPKYTRTVDALLVCASPKSN